MLRYGLVWILAERLFAARFRALVASVFPSESKAPAKFTEHASIVRVVIAYYKSTCLDKPA